MENNPVDWRRKLTLEVKDQKYGPYCCMLSVSTVVSAVFSLQENKNHNISEQLLIDVFDEIREEGVNRNDMERTLKNIWVTTADNYPAEKDAIGEYVKGLYDPDKIGPIKVNLKKMKLIRPKKGETMESAMMKMLEKHPILGCMSLQTHPLSYTKGVWSKGINHYMVIVGYGRLDESGQKYWIVQQSWGEDWGLDGHMLIKRGSNLCKIEQKAWFPILGTVEK